jgi:thioredoxin 1
MKLSGWGVTFGAAWQNFPASAGVTWHSLQLQPTQNMFKQLVAFTLGLAASAAFALTVKPYSAQTLADAQKANQAVTLHFHADWCPTCVAQSKALDALKTDASLKPVTVLTVDYDKEKDLRKTLKVRSQSTFVVFKGAAEVARNGGDTDPAKIKAALAKSL